MTEAVKMSEVEDYLMHYGVKGMKWGVRRTRDGGGVVTAKFRPTYTTQERRDAQKIAESAKKSGGSGLDKEGFSADRLAELRTPQRRLVNSFLGTKVSNLTYAASLVALIGTGVATGGAATPLAVAGLGFVGANLAGSGHVAYKVFFNNLAKNPSVKIKQKISADEMASYAAGRDFTKDLLGKHGTVRVSSVNGKMMASPMDREGRKLGTIIKDAKPPKSKPAKPAEQVSKAVKKVVDPKVLADPFSIRGTVGREAIVSVANSVKNL